MKEWFQNVVAYYKDNPEGYWFKRRLYGWGWMPVTWAGWAVLLGVIVVIVLNAIRAERVGYSDLSMFWQVMVPTAIAIAFLVFISIKKGEPPRWQWGPPKRKQEEVE